MTREELVKLIGSEHVDSLESLMDLTLSANEKFNLTAIKDKDAFRELMIYDSLIPLKYFDLTDKKVLDVGTGAGFPGLPLAISSQGKFTLLDSTTKKINHIKDVCKELNINNVTAVSARAEDFAKKNRESFDVVIARAVASLKVLVELTLPLVAVGGTLIAMKGSNAEEELKEASQMIKTLGGEVINVDTYELPSGEKRANILIKKVKATPKKYPRLYSEIIK